MLQTLEQFDPKMPLDTLLTILGPLTIWLPKEDTVILSNNQHGMDITVKEIPYYVYSKWTWNGHDFEQAIPDELTTNTFFVVRRSDHCTPATESVCRKIESVIRPALQRWYTEHEEFIRQAKIKRLQSELEEHLREARRHDQLSRRHEGDAAGIRNQLLAMGL
jgi:hypothetical protein